MKKTFVLPLWGVCLLAAMATLGAGCSPAVDTSGAPAPSTTVGAEIDDSVITGKIKSALLEDADVKSYVLKVETRKGEVMLSGFVDSPSQMDRAIAIAQAVAGVSKVDNSMTLKGAATTLGNKIDDGVITTKVRTALLADASIKSLDVAVVTRKGEVQLSGFVNNQGQIDHAMEVARGIEGVSSVGNEMSIKK
jgi:hyperosmotically inducible protein